MDNETLLHAGCVGTQEHDAGCGRAIGQREATATADAGEDGGARCEPAQPSEHRIEAPNPPQTLREFERALRSLGYSRTQAEHIGRKGFAGLHAEDAAPEPAPPDSLRHALERLSQAMKA